MIRLIQWLLLGHCHKWRTLSQHTLIDDKKRPTGAVFVQQCENCGTVRRKDLR